MKTVAISGYFDPLHVGHLEYIKQAKELGDYLIVIINNDKQAIKKKGKSFMNQDDRLDIIKALKWVDAAVIAVDKDGSVNQTLRNLRPDIFANGGDRNFNEAPEKELQDEWELELIHGLGNKIRSSSDLTGLKEIKK